MNLNMFEDATIVDLMYSLGVNPGTLVLLAFDSIDVKGNMTYFDTQIKKYLTVKLSQNLIRDLIKDHRFKHEKEESDSYRFFKDKLIVIGDLIINRNLELLRIHNENSDYFI